MKARSPLLGQAFACVLFCRLDPEAGVTGAFLDIWEVPVIKELAIE